MSSLSADRNLLFGIVALQLDFVNRDQLIAGMNAWVLDKAKSLGEVLVSQGSLQSERRQLLEALVQEHLKQHGGDPEQSLASLSSLNETRTVLEQIADPELQRSLAAVSRDRPSRDPDATVSFSVGESTSSGLRFRILRPYAEGGLGKVSVAVDEELHREVALKELKSFNADNPESRARFLLEAEISGGLEHPGIVPVYGLGQYADGRPFYAMRFIRGDNLKDAIERFHKAEKPGRDPGERSLEFRKLLGRFVDVCQAVHYAHSRGVLHRDLKPGNIMLGRYGETLVVDWGLAKAAGRPESFSETGESTLRPFSGSGSAPTEMGRALGTPEYMSPEQAEGRWDQVGPAADVYSLGATLYCILVGKPAFAREEVGETLKKVRQGQFSRPREVSRSVDRGLEAICLKAMALKLEGRYSTAAALAEDIEHWLADEPVSARRDPIPVRVRRFARRNRAIMAAVAGAFLVTIVSLGLGAVLIAVSKARLQSLNDALIKTNSKLEEALHAEADQKKQAQDSLAALRGVLERLTQVVHLAGDDATRQRVTDLLISVVLDGPRRAGARLDDITFGNIYEAIALADCEPERNFQQAIDAFRRASVPGNSSSAMALCSIGRCSYFALKESASVPSVLGKHSKEDWVIQCKTALEQAKSLDPDMAEAYYWLGMISQHQSDVKAAEGYFKTAKELAERHGSPVATEYFVAWAQASFFVGEKGGWEEKIRLMQRRVDELGRITRDSKPARADVIKELVRLRALLLRMERNYREARRVYDEVLPTNIAKADIPDLQLFIARGDLNLELALNERVPSEALAAAKAAMEDADGVASNLAAPRDIVVEARSIAACARLVAYRSSDRGVPEYLDEGIMDIREAIRLGARQTMAASLFSIGAELVLGRLSAQDAGENLPLYPEAIAWTAERERLRKRDTEGQAINVLVRRSIECVDRVVRSAKMHPERKTIIIRKASQAVDRCARFSSETRAMLVPLQHKLQEALKTIKESETAVVPAAPLGGKALATHGLVPPAQPPKPRERQETLPILPVRIDEQGRFVLRERLDEEVPIEIASILGKNPDGGLPRSVEELRRNTIERTLELKYVSAFDVQGNEVAVKNVAERLKEWTPVFIEYSDLDFSKPEEKATHPPGPHPLPRCIRVANRDSLLLVVPKPIFGAVQVKTDQATMPLAPAYCEIRMTNEKSAEIRYCVKKPVWESRTKVVRSPDGTEKEYTYQVCHFESELRTKRADLRALDVQLQNVRGKPLDPAALPELRKDFVPVLDPTGSGTIHDFYLKTLKGDVLMFHSLPEGTSSVAMLSRYLRVVEMPATLSELTTLNLCDRQHFGDRELERLKDATNLIELVLSGTAVTDAGLSCLRAMDELRTIDLSHTAVGDAGLSQLKGLKNLTFLDLRATKCSAEGVEQLKRALPGCSVSLSLAPAPSAAPPNGP